MPFCRSAAEVRSLRDQKPYARAQHLCLMQLVSLSWPDKPQCGGLGMDGLQAYPLVPQMTPRVTVGDCDVCEAWCPKQAYRHPS